MNTPQRAEGPAAGEEKAPAAMLQLPADWIDLLEDRENVSAALRRYQSLIQRIFPTMEEEARRQAVDALAAWRKTLWEDGWMAHGIIAVPATEEKSDVLWNIMVRLVKVPAFNREVNIGEVLTRLMKQDAENVLHVESFTTNMGLGAGMVATPEVPGSTPKEGQDKPPSFGAGAAISCAPGGGWGILAIGNAQDPTQAGEVAWLVSQIAAHSRLATEEEMDQYRAAAAGGPAPEQSPAQQQS